MTICFLKVRLFIESGSNIESLLQVPDFTVLSQRIRKANNKMTNVIGIDARVKQADQAGGSNIASLERNERILRRIKAKIEDKDLRFTCAEEASVNGVWPASEEVGVSSC